MTSTDNIRKIQKKFKPLRYVSGEMHEFHKLCKNTHWSVELVEKCFRGIGQIVFLNNPVTGFFLLLALSVYWWFAAVLAFLGNLLISIKINY